ncbi:MAG: hypothetical protein LBK41_06210 [Clostridiales bacterium]|jgi:hypothetical protein|nr:hypothetical protein [Clostridiales bacterium]
MFEEVIHMAQIRKDGMVVEMSAGADREMLRRETEATEKLFRNAAVWAYGKRYTGRTAQSGRI